MKKGSRKHRLCSLSGCNQPHSCKGYCARHYKQNKGRGQGCSVKGCMARHECRGFCSRHYVRFRAHGDPLFTKLPRGDGDTPEQRFWSRVDKTPGHGPNGDCWHWLGKPMNNGYGSLYWYGKNHRAHRVAWMLVKGVMPQMDLLHSCDNRLCCNPSHLREGTHRDNTKDMLIRERQSRGEHRPNAKLTNADIIAIRNAPKVWGFQTKLAKQYGVNTGAISRIRRGLIWRHVSQDEVGINE